jgi:toxin ParE1/3/4
MDWPRRFRRQAPPSGKRPEIYRYIAAKATPGIATEFAGGIVADCESPASFPLRGSLRGDLRPGVRIANYRSV